MPHLLASLLGRVSHLLLIIHPLPVGSSPGFQPDDGTFKPTNRNARVCVWSPDGTPIAWQGASAVLDSLAARWVHAPRGKPRTSSRAPTTTPAIRVERRAEATHLKVETVTYRRVLLLRARTRRSTSRRNLLSRRRSRVRVPSLRKPAAKKWALALRSEPAPIRTADEIRDFVTEARDIRAGARAPKGATRSAASRAARLPH
jgi:hypothetical protein